MAEGTTWRQWSVLGAQPS